MVITSPSKTLIFSLANLS
ncbi:hypothetical protein LINGRAHAP2_LOCUS12598 [Linum grandiflorum]